MRLFSITSPTPSVAEKIPTAFGKDASFEVIPRHAWVVGTNHKTAAEVFESLEIDEENTSIVICEIAGYYGIFDAALWQKMRAWREA